jgi:hypothetical protein
MTQGRQKRAQRAAGAPVRANPDSYRGRAAADEDTFRLEWTVEATGLAMPAAPEIFESRWEAAERVLRYLGNGANVVRVTRSVVTL